MNGPVGQPRGLEHLVDERVHALRGPLDGDEAERVRVLSEQRIDLEGHGREGRAQLVTGEVEELVAKGHGFLNLAIDLLRAGHVEEREDDHGGKGLRRGHFLREADEGAGSRRRVPLELEPVHDLAPRGAHRRRLVVGYSTPAAVGPEVGRLEAHPLAEHGAAAQLLSRELVRRRVRVDDSTRPGLSEQHRRRDHVEQSLEPRAIARTERRRQRGRGHVDGEEHAPLRTPVPSRQRLADVREVARLDLPGAAPVERQRLGHADARPGAPDGVRDSVVDPSRQLRELLAQALDGEVAISEDLSRGRTP